MDAKTAAAILPSVIVLVDNGRVDQILSDIPINVEIIEHDIDNAEAESLIKVKDVIYSYYLRFPDPLIDKALVNKFLRAIDKARIAEKNES